MFPYIALVTVLLFLFSLYAVLKPVYPFENRFEAGLVSAGTLVFMVVAAPELTPEERAKRDHASAERACSSQKHAEFVMLQDPVKARLRAPSTAVFPWSSGAEIAYLGNCRYAVVSYVDAQNGFGGTVRQYWKGSITYDGGHWRNASVTFIR